MLWTINNCLPMERPHRVRLDDDSTRTGPAVTDEILFALGWSQVREPVEGEEWDGYNWVVRPWVQV